MSVLPSQASISLAKLSPRNGLEEVQDIQHTSTSLWIFDTPYLRITTQKMLFLLILMTSKETQLRLCKLREIFTFYFLLLWGGVWECASSGICVGDWKYLLGVNFLSEMGSRIRTQALRLLIQVLLPRDPLNC